MRRSRIGVVAPNRETVGYVRVSTDDQVRDGVSLFAQEERIRARCVADGRNLTHVFCDGGQSGKTLYRPALARMMNDISARTIGAVVVLKLDRLTRSVRDLAELLDLFARYDVALVSVTESLDTSSAAGELLVNILGSVAQWERKAIAERTVAALAHLRRSGKAYARTPYGYVRSGDELVKEPLQQHALGIIRNMRATGDSFRAIAAKLNLLAVKPPRGRVWYPSSIYAVLTSKMALE